MKKAHFTLGNNKKPEIEINKTTNQKFWQNPNFTLLLYVLFILISFEWWQGFQQVRQEEIPYSAFLAHVQKHEVAEAVVTNKVITGTLTLKDKKTDKPWRSDVIIIVAVDFKNKQVGIISFPRDLYLDIPTVGKNRINTATFFGKLNNYPDGGAVGLLEKTLKQDFNIRVDHYIELNFESFIQIVDALGGVDIVVDRPLTGEFPIAPGTWRHSWRTLQPGKYHMDGRLALAYVRERKTTSDIDRNRRQQQMILALRKRAIDVNVIPRIPALYTALKDNIETDLGLSDIISLTRLGLQVNLKDVHRFNIGYKQATNWKTPDGASVLIPNMSKIQAGIQALFTK